MTGLIILVRGTKTISLRMADDSILNHAAQLATFLRSDAEIHVFDDDSAVWSGRVPSGQMPLLGGVR